MTRRAASRPVAHAPDVLARRRLSKSDVLPIELEFLGPPTIVFVAFGDLPGPTGFALTYTITPDATRPPPPPSPVPLVCSLTRLSAGQTSGTIGYRAGPGLTYPPSENCVLAEWQGFASRLIEVTFSFMDTEENYDFVRFEASNYNNQFSGQSLPAPFTFPGADARVRFTSDPAIQKDRKSVV